MLVVDRLVKTLPAQLIEAFRERDKHSKPACLYAFGKELFRHPDFSWSGQADCQPQIAYQPQ